MTRDASTALPRRYWTLWSAAAISNLGDGMFIVALPLLAARITDAPVSVGLITVFFSIPWLLFAVPAGVLIDRLDRRTVLISADLFRGALVGSLALVAAFGDVQMWMLWVLAFGLGVGEVFFDNTSQTILPGLVTSPQLDRANGYFYAAETASNTFLGLPLGSLLFSIAVWLPFGVDAASFVIAALLASTLRGSFRVDREGSATSMAADMREGLRWVRHNAPVRNLAAASALLNLSLAATQATFVLFALEELGITEGVFGPLVAVVGAGSLIAGVLGGRIVDFIGRRPAMLTASLVCVVTMLAIGLRPVAWSAIMFTAVFAAMFTIWSIVAVSLRQRLVPNHMFGRVNGVYRWLSTGATPVGALLGSFAASTWGLRAPYFGAAVALLIAFLVVAKGLPASTFEPLPDTAVEGAVDESEDDTPVSIQVDPLDDLL